MLELGNVGLRAVTMGSRLVLLFFLARLLPPADVGLYGLLVASVAYGIMVLGLDFYTFSTRELLGHDRSEWPRMLRDQAVLHGCAYMVALPLAYLLFHLGILPLTMAGWFFALLVAEHVGKELNRLLIVAGMPVMATTALFLQRGLWALAVPLLMLQFEALRTLNLVFLAWTISALGAILMSIWSLRTLAWSGMVRTVDWSWIRRGLRVASVFLLGTLLHRVMFTIDRFIVESAGGLDLVGVYTFYMGMALAAMAFLDAGVFAFLYPRVVSAFRRGELAEFRSAMRKLLVRTVGATGVLMAAAAVMIHPILALLDRPIYQTNIAVFWVLLGAVSLYAVGMIPHFGLYAMGRDRAILVSRAAGSVVFLIVALLGAHLSPLLGVGAGILAGCGTLGLVNLIAYRSSRPVPTG